jgi:hypothetical protein
MIHDGITGGKVPISDCIARIIRISAGTAAVCVVFLLSGCGTPGVQRSGGNVTIDAQPKAGQGAVLIETINVRPPGVLNAKWTSLVIESKRTGAPISLDDIAKLENTASVFYSHLDAGEYEITQVVGLAGSPPGLLMAALMTDSQQIRSRLGTFTVSANATSNLGILVFAPPVGKNAKDWGIQSVQGPAGRQAVLSDLQRITGQTLELKTISGWVQARPDTEEPADLARARSWASQLSKAELANDKPLIGGTVLGQILERDAAGLWRAQFLDNLASVTYVRRTDDGGLIAGADFGLYYMMDRAKPWLRYQLPNRDMAVIHIEPLPGNGALIVASDLRKTIVYHNANLADPKAEPRKLLELDASFRFWNPILSTDASLVLPVNYPGIRRTSDFHVIDKKTLSIAVQKQDFWINQWQKLPSGDLLITRQNGMSYYVSSTSDTGKSWVHGETEGPYKSYFVDRQVGYGIDITRGAFSVSNQLMKTVDGGKTWTPTGSSSTLDIGSEILWVSPRGEILIRAGWEVLSSTDEGKTWKQELPVSANHADVRRP